MRRVAVCVSILLLFTAGLGQAGEGNTAKQSAKVYVPKQVKTLPLPSRPAANHMNPAQVAFWDYLEQFNRLPDNPSAEAIAVFKAQGIPPDFRYLETASTSVLGNIDGLVTHRKQFLARYPWVQPLLDRYSLELPVSAERFSGTAQEIGEKYKELIRASQRAEHNAQNEKEYVANFLEGLLVVDYIYGCGTEQDKEMAMEVFNGVFEANRIHPHKDKLAASLHVPASMDVGWPIIADFPERILALTTALVRTGFSESSHTEKVNFSKWLLRTPGVDEMKSPNKRDLEHGLIHNEQVKAGLLSYSIYAYHYLPAVRPEDSPGLIVIESLFEKVFPKDHRAQFRRYLSLLNDAYPKAPK